MSKNLLKVVSDVSLIISTYKNPLALAGIFRVLETSSVIPRELLIAEDGMCEETNSLIKKVSQIKTSHFRHEDNGFRKSKILNCALRDCSGKYIIFLDGDCLPHKHFIKDHLIEAEKGFFVQGRRCFIQERQVQRLLDKKTTILRLILSGKVSGLLKSFRLPRPKIKINKNMYGLLGCNLGAWREDLLSVNGFDEDYEGWGREDSDLGARLYNLGLQRKVVYGRALVYHLNHPENKRDNLQENDRKLSETIKSGKVRCKNGIIKE